VVRAARALRAADGWELDRAAARTALPAWALVPSRAAIVTKVRPVEGGGAVADLRDPSGDVQAELDASIASDKRFLIVEGSAVVLRDVAVFRHHMRRDEFSRLCVPVAPSNVHMVVHPSVRVDKAGASAERELRRNDREVLGFMEDNSERLDKHGEVQEEEQSTAPLRKTGSERAPNKSLTTVRTVEVLETQRFISGAVSAPAAPAAPAPVPPPASDYVPAPTNPAATAAAMTC
jgi:hypothetical protein